LPKKTLFIKPVITAGVGGRPDDSATVIAKYDIFLKTATAADLAVGWPECGRPFAKADKILKIAAAKIDIILKTATVGVLAFLICSVALGSPLADLAKCQLARHMDTVLRRGGSAFLVGSGAGTDTQGV
jgi:hypothetical protein